MTPRMENCLNLYRGDVFRKWAITVRDNWQAHGSDLVLMLGSPYKGKPGLVDNNYAADELLKAAIAEGWIEQVGGFAPSAEQQFFGVAGLSRGCHGWGDPKHMPKTVYYYTYCPVKAAEFRLFCAGDEDEMARVKAWREQARKGASST